MSASEATPIRDRLVGGLDAGDHEAVMTALREGYELFSREGIEGWLDILDPEIEWTEGEDVPEVEVYRGIEGVIKQQREYEQAFESLRLEPQDFLAAGDRLLVWVRLTLRGRGSGVEVEGRAGHLWTLRDGMVRRMEMLTPEKTEELAAELRGAGPGRS